MPGFLPYLLLAGLPFAVAGQNVVTGVVILGAILWMRRHSDLAKTRWTTLLHFYQIPMLLSASIVAVLALATGLNPLSPTGIRGALELIPGHLGWVALTPLLYITTGPIDEKTGRKLFRFLVGITFGMALVSLTQVIWGWRLVDQEIGIGITRAQVFYSHPLTLAYVGICLFPAGFLLWIRNFRDPLRWVLFLSSASLIVTSGSRTVQLVCLLMVLINLLMKLRGRMRIACVTGFFVLLLGIGLTKNPVSDRYRQLVTRSDVRSDYLDDRVAFWHAHWLMFQERPLLGHGDHLGRTYREPYYAALGLKDFERQYEAHNMFIQIAVNSGILGLFIFLVWWLWHVRFAMSLRREQPYADIVFQTLLVFILASLTQNSFQDAEPRYALTLVITALVLMPKRSQQH